MASNGTPLEQRGYARTDALVSTDWVAEHSQDPNTVEAGEKLRVNPLVHWSRGEIWRYILDNQLPYNPLHDKGYTSIGDEPLTTPVASDEDERAGRWRGAAITECGIHLV